VHAEDLGQVREDARQRLADDFGIVLQADRGRPDEVREKNGDKLPFLRNARSLGESKNPSAAAPTLWRRLGWRNA
jgi:hypothetical protein